MALLLKRLTMELALPIILAYLFALATLWLFLYSFRGLASYKVSGSLFALLLLASLLAVVANLFDLRALSLAPNAGYAAAIKGGQIILITLGAYFLFKGQSITVTGALGALMIVLGIGLLSIQPSSD